MTVDYLPRGVKAKGMGALFVAPAVADMQAPTLTEFTDAGAFTAHCDLYSWNWRKPQEKIAEPRYCLTEDVQEFGDAKFEVDDLEVLYDPQQPDSENFVAYKNLKEGTTWFVFDRRGMPSREALKVGDIGDVLKVTVGATYRAPNDQSEGQKFRQIIPLAIIEKVAEDVAIVAAPVGP